MSRAWLTASLRLWKRRHTYRQRKADYYHQINDKAGVEKWYRLMKEAGVMVRRRRAQLAALDDYVITTTGGALGIVQQAYSIARRVGGSDIYVASGYRPGSTTSSGNRSDHNGRGPDLAANDIADQGYDVLWGPPSPELNAAAVKIGKAFGRDYGNGAHRIVDTFYWRGFRVQVIWHTPEYGGHLGHIHVGVRRL